MHTVTAYIEWDPETKLFVGVVPGIPGAHSEGASIDELRDNPKEVVELCLEEQHAEIDSLRRGCTWQADDA